MSVLRRCSLSPDGLPARFENVYLEVYAEEGAGIPMPTPKRGIPVVAR